MSDSDVEEISVNGKSSNHGGNPRKKLKIEPSAGKCEKPVDILGSN